MRGRSSLRLVVAGTLVAAFLAVDGSGQEPQAEEWVRRALELEGGKAWESLNRLYVQQRGRNWNPRQGYGPGESTLKGEKETLLHHWFYDFDGHSHRGYERSYYYGGHDLRFEELYRDGKSYSIPTEMGVYVSNDAQFSASFEKLTDVPGFVLSRISLDAVELEWLGRRTVEGEDLPSVGVKWGGLNRVLHFDPASGRLRALSWKAPDRITGQRSIVRLYEGRRSWGRLVTPSQVKHLVNGSVWSQRNITAVEGDGTIPAEVFELSGLRPAVEGGGPPAPKLAKIKGPVREINGLGFNLYRVPFIEFEEFVAVYDAVLASGLADMAVSRISQATGGKPIRYLILSHRHTDHIGAVRAFAAQGAEIVTSAKTRSMVEALLEALDSPANALPEGFRPEQVSIIEVAQGVPYQISDGKVSLQVHNLGQTPHVDDLLVVTFPAHGLVIQADSYFTFSCFGSQFAFFAEWAKDLGWPETTITGVHHGPISLADLLEQSTRTSGTTPAYLQLLGLPGQ